MRKIAEISYLGIEEDKKYEQIINRVFEACFKEENLYDYQMYVSIILTNEEEIQKINKEYRNIDKETDVLSFPMFEKTEIEEVKAMKEVLGDIIVCIPVVKRQAVEYEHSEEREFAYMLVHGFYHLMGYDHIEESDKKQMREKEEILLNKLSIKS